MIDYIVPGNLDILILYIWPNQNLPPSLPFLNFQTQSLCPRHNSIGFRDSLSYNKGCISFPETFLAFPYSHLAFW